MAIGDQNEQVKALQICLKSIGLFAGEPTSYFGGITRASVKAYQTLKGIEPLGIVGPKTLLKLNEDFS
jgi:peptidoglycan hydrolase-like protein with peptidoglycan-binding domain